MHPFQCFSISSLEVSLVIMLGIASVCLYLRHLFFLLVARNFLSSHFLIGWKFIFPLCVSPPRLSFTLCVTHYQYIHSLLFPSSSSYAIIHSFFFIRDRLSIFFLSSFDQTSYSTKNNFFLCVKLRLDNELKRYERRAPGSIFASVMDF